MAQKNGDFLIQYYAPSKKFQLGAYQSGGVWNGGPLSVTSPVIGKWYRIDWTWNQTNGKSNLYINKILESTTTITNKGISTNQLTIGNKASGSDRALNGSVNNFKIRNYAMTTLQIQNDN